ncbi:hypothetical protein ACFXOQ_37550, partial [Streptomyces californicus]
MAGVRAVRTRARIAALLLLVGVAATGCGGSGGETSTGGDLCSPPGQSAAAAAPTNLASSETAGTDRYTTPTTVPLESIDTSKLGLLSPGKLSVGT